MQWSAKDWNGIAWNGMECHGVGWKRMKWNVMWWTGHACNGASSGEMCWYGTVLALAGWGLAKNGMGVMGRVWIAGHEIGRYGMEWAGMEKQNGSSQCGRARVQKDGRPWRGDKPWRGDANYVAVLWNGRSRHSFCVNFTKHRFCLHTCSEQTSISTPCVMDLDGLAWGAMKETEWDGKGIVEMVRNVVHVRDVMYWK